VFLLGIELLLFLTNYKFGTFLVGWDNLFPEFDFKTSFIRSLFSVWQEYRGLGLLDGMAHPANLVHTLYLFLLSLLFPLSSLRYLYIHLTHIVGVVNMYFLLKKLTKNNTIFSIFGALFYGFNLGVIQMYFAPFEVFATHFAALPLLTLLAYHVFENPRRKQFLLFLLGVIAMTPQGFVPTVFIAFSVFFVPFLMITAWQKSEIKTGVILLICFIAGNAFWASPYAYSALHTAHIIKTTRINEFSSEEIFYRNQARGNFTDVISLRGFMVDTIEQDLDGNNVFFLAPWRLLSTFPLYTVLFIGVFILACIGMLHKKSRSITLPYTFTFLIAFFFLANNTPVLAQMNTFLRDHFPLFGEAFRFPFTKFITVFAFSYTILLTLSLTTLIAKLSEKRQEIIATLGFFCLVLISAPAFLGYFTSPYLRLAIPSDYFSVFRYMQTQPETTRVALFPTQTFWNWQYRSWGQRGSGFIWQGLPQASLERAFDPWSSYNEQFYNEVSYAVNNDDPALLTDVLKKYGVSYIVLDQYIKNALTPQPINFERIKRLLSQTSIVQDTKKFGRVWVYKLTPAPSATTVHAEDTLKAYPTFSYEKQDFNIDKTYILDKQNPDIITLLPSLLTEKLQSDNEFSVKQTGGQLVFTPKKKYPLLPKGTTLFVPNLFKQEFLIPASVKLEQDTLIIQAQYPTIHINNKLVSPFDVPVRIPLKKVTSPTQLNSFDTKQQITLIPGTEQHVYLINSILNTFSVTDGKQTEIVPVDARTFSRDDFSIPLPDTHIDSITIAVNLISSPLALTHVIKNQQYTLQKDNSDPALRLDRSFADITVNDNGVTMETRGSANDLIFYDKNLFHEASYVMLVDATYESGLPMSFYLDNPYEKRAEVESLLSKTDKNNIFVLPKSQGAFSGYGFHFTVKSLGRELAKSTLSEISLYPFPATFLRNITLRTPTFALVPNINPVTPLPLLTHSTYSSTVSIPESTATRFLTLSQAYDEAWEAYAFPTDKLTVLDRILPFIGGGKLSGHTEANNWENAWVLGGNNAKQTVVFMFWPQYLQYFGYLFLGGVFLFIFFTTPKNRL
jgi:hypothetical protein